MTDRAIARYVLGGLLFVGGLGFAAFLAHPDINAALTMIGLGVAYAGADLLRIRPTDRRVRSAMPEEIPAAPEIPLP